LLSGPTDDDDGIRHQDDLAQPALHLARRRRRRRLGGCACVVEAAGHADLARRAGDDGGCGHVADGPTPACRRSIAPSREISRRRGPDPAMNMKSLLAVFVVFATMLSSGAAFAVTPGEMLANPALEARARTISEGLRC